MYKVYILFVLCQHVFHDMTKTHSYILILTPHFVRSIEINVDKTIKNMTVYVITTQK